MLQPSSLKKAIKFAIAGICLVFIAVYFRSRKEEFFLVFNLDLRHNLGLLLFIALVNFLNGWKNLILLKHLGLQNIRMRDWFKIYILSRFINLNLLQSGNIYRCVKLKNAYAFPYTKAISSSVFFVWFEIVSILVIVSALIFSVPPQESFGRFSILKITAATLAGLIVLPLATHQIWLRLDFRQGKLAWANQKLSDLNTYFLKCLKEPRLLGIYFLLTGIVFMIFSRMTQVSFDAIGRPAGFFHAALFTAMIFITRSVNIVPGNIGISEVICGYFAEVLGNTIGEGILVSSIIRIVDYVFLALVSVFYLRFNFQELKSAGPSEDP